MKDEALRSARAEERGAIRVQFDAEMTEWRHWLLELEDAELVMKARKMDIELDDIPVPAYPEDEIPNYVYGIHYEIGEFGNCHLRMESRSALRKNIREKASAYRKERREWIDLLLKAGTILIGLIGATTGLVALLKK
jgi:hypothetical protein